MLKDRDIRKLTGYRGQCNTFVNSPADIYCFKSDNDPNKDSIILNNIDYLIIGYLSANRDTDGFNNFVSDLVEEIRKRY